MTGDQPDVVRSLIAEGAAMLRGHCVEPVELDARFTLAHVLGITPSELAAMPWRTVQREGQQHYRALIAERATGRPLAQVLGEWEFRGIPLTITPDVLTPRPATETLVDVALEHIPVDGPCRVLDIGVGSGAIAIAIALERPNARVVGVDISEAALAVCRQNIERHGLVDRIALLRSDFHQGSFVEMFSSQLFDVVVSNPPYIERADPRVDEAVRTFEPGVALFDDLDGDGLGSYRHLARLAPPLLTNNGTIVLEVGEEQASDVHALFEVDHVTESRNDLQGIERVVIARKP